ncbi:hypothetical protein Btru_051078 [Bulinus truncatus]|nr:hypothetical protein Btru_051078 [Bulinus truncatus]
MGLWVKVDGTLCVIRGHLLSVCCFLEAVETYVSCYTVNGVLNYFDNLFCIYKSLLLDQSMSDSDNVDFFSSDFIFNHNDSDKLFDFSDVLYGDVDFCSTSFNMSTSTFGGMTIPSTSPWSGSDSGVSEIVSENSISSLAELELSIKSEHDELKDDHCFSEDDDSRKMLAELEIFHDGFKSINNNNDYFIKQSNVSNYSNVFNIAVNKPYHEDHKNYAKIKPKLSNSETSNTTQIEQLDNCQRAVIGNGFQVKENMLHTCSLQENPSLPTALTGQVSTEDRCKKNALQAKLNREKKKAYIKSLEAEIETLKCHNNDLKSENGDFKLKNAELEKEVEYLKSVLFNSSALSAVLKNIDSASGVRLSSTITNRKRKLENPSSCFRVNDSERQIKKKMNAGICLHVSSDQTSIELCAHCSSLAQITFEHS